MVDTFDIILGLISTVLSMQKNFLAVSEAHKKVQCHIETCKVNKFLEVFDKILFADKSYNEMRRLFTEPCVKYNSVFNCMCHLCLPENNGKADKIGDIVKNLDNLRDKELDLVNKVLDIRKQKRKAQEDLKEVLESITS